MVIIAHSFRNTFSMSIQENADFSLKVNSRLDKNYNLLFSLQEIKQKIAEKKYDPKRSCYVPHSEEKFCEGMIEETNGAKIKVKINATGESKEFKADLVTQVNL